MESASSSDIGIPESSLDLTFGFDDAKFSDRTLLLEIVQSDDQNVKRLDDLPIAMGPPVKTVHINSLILAARSHFFRKLFSNGMLESEQKNVTLRIDASEEASLMDLLKYVYSNKLPSSVSALLDLLVRADKFEVTSCSRDCTRSLQNLPMTCESASLYLDLPPSVLMSPVVEPLTNAAKQFLIANFKNLDKFKKKMLDLPLSGIQTILSSDDLEVTSENVVYDFVLEWAYKHYSDSKERSRILKTHLFRLIRFPFMTTRKLTEEVQTYSGIDPEDALKIVVRALSFKAETPHRKRYLAAEDGSRQFLERSYKCRPIKLIELALPHQQQCIVYLHFTREQLTCIFPEGRILSESFHLGEQELVLFGTCFKSKTNDNLEYFLLGLQVLGSATHTIIDCEIQLRMKSTEKFERWWQRSRTFSTKKKVRYSNPVPWTEFIGVDSTYFINDLLHVRAEFTIKE